MTNNSLNNEALESISVKASTAGVSRYLVVKNTDNSNSASHAKIQVTTGGSSGGDPYSSFSTTATSSSLGIDNSTSDSFKIAMSATPETTTSKNIASGNITRPLQPAFHAYRTGNVNDVTGNGAQYGPVVFNTEILDQNGDYDSGTGTFTAPITGRYFLNGTTRIVGLSGVGCFIRNDIVTTGYTWTNAYASPRGDHLQTLVSVVAPMDAGDTAVVKVITIGAAGNTNDLGGGIYTYFSGVLLQ